MTLTIPLVPVVATFGLLVVAVLIADRIGGGGAGAFFLTFPASVVALLLSIIVWWAYFAMGAP